jgi:hypothetical protein
MVATQSIIPKSSPIKSLRVINEATIVAVEVKKYKNMNHKNMIKYLWFL